MKQSFRLFFTTIALLLMSCNNQSGQPETSNAEIKNSRPDYAIVIHGGAGTILKAEMTREMDADYRKALNEALDVGENILKAGGTSMDAVEQTIQFLEDSELFNAGRGSVFTHDGKNEMDASFMDGATKNAGAIGGVTIVKHPISLARAVLEKSEHVMLNGKGAEQFALEQNIETVDPSYFYTERRWNALQEAKAVMDNQVGAVTDNPMFKFGTVGCVALDRAGNLAAGTSTGGMTNKKYNRIGDSPIIGAGTYADNNTCAVSCTGHGEFFIRYSVAHDLSAMLEYSDVNIEEAGEKIVNLKLFEAGGAGGLIALDKDGNVTMPFNTEGMYRGYAKSGQRVVKIYKKE